MTSRLSKKQLINDIKIFFLKQGKECDGINKISKNKLIDIILENDIPHIDDNTLKKEIEETEKYNYYTQIIFHNFIKYNNIPYDILKNLKLNPNLSSNDLFIIIQNYNLKFDNDIIDTQNLVLEISNAIHKYCSNTFTKNTIQFKTIPSIISFLSNLNSS